MAASHLAARAAPHILAELSRIYGVATWDIQTFQRFFLEGALRAWKPGTRVARIGGALCVISPDCPLRSQALRDPRVCHVCRLVQVLVTKTALGEAASDVGFEQLVTKGADACVLVIRRRPPDEAGPA